MDKRHKKAIIEDQCEAPINIENTLNLINKKGNINKCTWSTIS